MTAADRLGDGYQPDFDLDLEVGRQGELFVANIADAIATQSIEVKTDARAASTGNVYIEYECLRRDGWKPSGIQTTSALLWAFVVNDVAIVAPTDAVKDVARQEWRFGRKSLTRGSHPTNGVVVPLSRYVQRLTTGRGLT